LKEVGQGNQTKGEADMRTIVSALIVSAVLMVWGLPSVPAQAEQQRGKQGSVQQQGTTEARDARDNKEPTTEDMNTKPSRNTSDLKDTSYQEQTPSDIGYSRDARDNKEPTAEDMNTKLSRDTSGLKDTSYQEQASQGSEDSRDARDNKEAGSGSYK
jgi:hypothetical protein